MQDNFGGVRNTSSQTGVQSALDAAARLRRSLGFLQEEDKSVSQVLRSEYKYLLTLDQAKALERKIGVCVAPDPHNGVNGYAVRSLYFDTPNHRDYVEKLDGVDPRRKLRLRIYHADDSFASLEMKQKQNNQQRKRSLKITREDAQRLIRGEYDALLNYNTAFARECFTLMCMGLYRPKNIVQFNRGAYIGKENDTRITFDRELRSTQACFDLFSPNLCLYPAMNPYGVILEVKYNHFLLDYIKQLLRTVDRTAEAQSKYCLACAGTL